MTTPASMKAMEGNIRVQNILQLRMTLPTMLSQLPLTGGKRRHRPTQIAERRALKQGRNPKNRIAGMETEAGRSGQRI